MLIFVLLMIHLYGDLGRSHSVQFKRYKFSPVQFKSIKLVGHSDESMNYSALPLS